MIVLYKRADTHMNELTQDSNKFRPEKNPTQGTRSMYKVLPLAKNILAIDTCHNIFTHNRVKNQFPSLKWPWVDKKKTHQQVTIPCVVDQHKQTLHFLCLGLVILWGYYFVIILIFYLFLFFYLFIEFVRYIKRNGNLVEWIGRTWRSEKSRKKV